MEALFLQILWDIAENIARRHYNEFDREPLNPISRWANQWVRAQSMSDSQRRRIDFFTKWREMPMESKQQYYDEYMKERQEWDEKWIRSIQEHDLPPIAGMHFSIHF